MQIFLARNNVQAGPYTLDQLNAMLAIGDVQLDDLMWHEGMANWQRLGDVTGNQAHYAPSGHTTAASSFTSQVEQSNHAAGEKVSLERLYGKSEIPSNDKLTSNPSATKSRTPVSLGKAKAQPQRAGAQAIVLAPIMSRILALAINTVLYILSILPLLMAFTKLDIDFEKFQSLSNFEAAYQYSVSLIDTIPDSTILMSQVMMLALFAVQLLLIIRRGQSLGKMMTGIRVVDQQTHRLPPLARSVGMRTLLLLVLYNLIFSFTSFLGLAVIALHYFMAAKSPQNIGLHDRLAKTLVVKASDEQLQK